MSKFKTIYRVQSEQVRGERRAYWIEKRSTGGAFILPATVVQDFGPNKRAAEKRCDELNAERSQAPHSSSEEGR